jgi:hypothetical protein
MFRWSADLQFKCIFHKQPENPDPELELKPNSDPKNK